MAALWGLLVRWAPLLIVMGALLLQGGAWGRPRLRHAHRKWRCTKCPPGWGVLQACSAEADTVCEQCAAGRAYSPHHSFRSPCWLCSRCGGGLFEAHPCRPAADTVCDDCARAGVVPNDDFFRKCNVTLPPPLSFPANWLR
ncbi:hypothetical protein R5R35_002990 [Gryllus longicercus]|uniref:TNFR-Cys domain-containing protein n=1 Tax=Gryllus longicercus TaxID=2509291 RepID=A0AAN9VPR6_9ORTH